MVELPRDKKLELSESARKTLHRIRCASDGPPAPIVLWVLRRTLLPPQDSRHFTPVEAEKILHQLEGYLFKTLLAGDSLTNMRAGVIGSMAKIDRECVNDAALRGAEVAIRRIDSWTDVRWSSLEKDLENANKRHDSKGVYGALGVKATLALLDAIAEELSGNVKHGLLPIHWAFGEDPYWVEHIYPQKPSKGWVGDLKVWGEKSEEMARRLHDLGNLSALPSDINKSLSNKSFRIKRNTVEAIPVAKSSVLQDWLDKEKWTVEEVDDRSYKFVSKLRGRWPDPLT